MSLQSIKINALRNLQQVSLSLSPQINLLHGDNGSGKTSFLEAIYLLGMGRTFRSLKSQVLVQLGCEACTVFAEIHSNNILQKLGVQRTKNNELNIHLNQQNVTSASKLAELLPLQLINHESFALIDGAPKVRRKFIDWGAFHANGNFIDVWQRTLKSLQQRNMWLKTASSNDYDVWTAEFEHASNDLDNLRKNYITDLVPVFKRISQQIIPSFELDLLYKRGWDENKPLGLTLANSLERDRIVGFTSFGPQKADLKITANGQNADEILSRGQQKLASYALLLAQGYLLSSGKRKQCVYLVDDLSAELDTHHQQIICTLLEDLTCQIFITATSAHQFNNYWHKSTPLTLFHVKQGQIA